MPTIHASTAVVNALERRLDRRSDLRPAPVLPPLWRPIIIDLDCKTRILLVTDGLSFNPGSGFGLSEAAGIIASATTTNHDVEVTTAHWNADPTADVENFRFAGNHTVNGVSRTIHHYEEIWIFGLGGATTATAMNGSDLDELETFMDDGGGVFCTGDHDDLGAFLSGNVKRVKSMRLWFEADGVPDGSDADTRIDTNVPNAAAGADFDLQSDNVPQHIYPKWYTDNGVTFAHELFDRHDVDGTVTHLPDHPHEGRVVEPATIDPDEFPDGIGPEIVAWGVSGGPGTSSKDPVTPSLFGVVGAYDGHQADVGRVVVESTWHHYVNINLNGTGAGPLAGGVAVNGLYDAADNPTPEYEQIQQYFQNIAGWLEPNHIRICSIVIWLPCLRWSWPLVQEIDFRRKPDITRLVAVGQSVVGSLAGRRGGTAEDLVSLLTAELDLDPRVRTYLDPRWLRSRRRVKRLDTTPLIDRDKIVAAVIGGAMWNLADSLPDTEIESVALVRRLLNLDGDRPDTSKLLSILVRGAEQALEMIGHELGGRGNGVTALRKALVTD